MRSASSCAFSMYWLPSAVIRFAARISSGMAARIWSMRSIAVGEWIATFCVIGNRRPSRIRLSRRLTRNMMSIGRALLVSLRPIIAPYRRARAVVSASTAAGGISSLTSPPNSAISRTRLELT